MADRKQKLEGMVEFAKRELSVAIQERNEVELKYGKKDPWYRDRVEQCRRNLREAKSKF